MREVNTIPSVVLLFEHKTPILDEIKEKIKWERKSQISR